MRLWLDLSIRFASGGNSLLRSAHSLVQALRDAQIEQARQAGPPALRSTEVIWRHASPMEDYDTDWVPHRVVRKSPHTVLVEANPAMSDYQPDEWSNSRQGRTYRLSRWELERIGVARVRSRRIVFFTRPNATDEAVQTIESILRLGLWFPYTGEDLRQAYLHRASQHHPDAGGSEEKFIQLQHDQERAMAALSLPVNSSEN